MGYTASVNGSEEVSPPDLAKEKAAPAGPRNGSKSAYETGRFQYEPYPDDPAICKVEVTDASPYNLDLIDGTRLPMRCDPAGLISAHDFATLDGGVVRIERRLVEVLPGLSTLDTRAPSYWSETDATRASDKALFVSLWNGMPATDKASFLRNVVGLSGERRAAA